MTGQRHRPRTWSAHPEHWYPVPAGFFDTPAMREALASYDFGRVFRAVRVAAAISQVDLGLMVELPQSVVSEVERGKRHVEDVAVVARIARALGIPARLLGFDTSPAREMARSGVNWMDRRDFFATVMAITLGSGPCPELEVLERLQPSGDAPVPHRIGDGDVEAIEKATAWLRQMDNQYGGGRFLTVAVAHLNHARALRTTACSDKVRARLQLATADLALTAAWMNYDVERHGEARKLWTMALDMARQAAHPRSPDLTAELLLDTAHQALHLHAPDEALRLVQIAAAAATTHSYPVSAGTRAYIDTTLGWCHATLGEAEACRRAMDTAQQTYADADPGTAPPWAADVVPAEIIAQVGHAQFLLSRFYADFAPAAVEHLSRAVDGYGPAFVRSRAVNLPGLATSYFRVGDLDAAVATGHRALAAITALSSTRAYVRLRDLKDVASDYQHRSEVADLCEKIRKTVSSAA